MQSLLNAGKITLDIISFLALMGALLWLMNPFIPGVHLRGFWDFLLGLLGMYGFYALAGWIFKSSKKKSSVKTS